MKILLTLEKGCNLKGIIFTGCNFGIQTPHGIYRKEKETMSRQFEEIMRKERLKLEKQEHERKLELKKLEMELIYREKFEMERLQVEKLRFQNEAREYWDSFDTTVNISLLLEDIGRLNYLRAQLCPEAKDVIAGLEVTSYTVAADLLKKRYSNEQLIIDAH